MKKSITLIIGSLLLISIIGGCASMDIKKMDPALLTYIYSTDGKINMEPNEIAGWNWGFVDTNYNFDDTYSRVLKCGSGLDNGVVAAKLVFIMNPGFIKGYKNLNFKIRADGYKKLVVLVEKAGGPWLQTTINVSEGWSDKNINLASLGTSAQLDVCDKILIVGDGEGAIYATDVVLIK